MSVQDEMTWLFETAPSSAVEAYVATFTWYSKINSCCYYFIGGDEMVGAGAGARATFKVPYNDNDVFFF